METLLVLTALFVSYSLAEAYVEGLYQDYLYTLDRNHPNLHPVYMLQRCLVLYLIWSNVLPLLKFVDALMFIIALCSMYSFFHNGLLYTVRNMLTPEIYKKRWWDNKAKGTDRKKAIWELNVYVRTIMFIFGVITIVYLIHHL